MSQNNIFKNNDLTMTAGELVVTALIAENVDTVFGITGSHVIGIYDALSRTPSIRAISARHESSVTFMGAGYARVTGRVGVIVVTAGPGILNALNGISQANFSALPLVVIAGGPPNNARPFELHTLEQENYSSAVVSKLVKYAARPQTVRDIGEALSKAFAVAVSGRPGPVYIEIPWDLFTKNETCNISYRTTDATDHFYDEEDVQRACNALSTKSKKLIIIDKRVIHDEVIHIQFLAENIGAGICVSRDALGFINETHPLYRGVVHDHMFGSYGFDAIKEADMTLLFGFDDNSDNYYKVSSKIKGTLINLKQNSMSSGSLTIKKVCEKLLLSSCQTKELFIDISHINNKIRLTSEIKNNNEENLYLKTLVALRERMNAEDISIVDAGNHEVWTRTIFPVTSVLSCIGGANWASMGYALPTAIAARVAYPEIRIICSSGDGCILMSLMDLSTFFEVNGPSILVILNDSEYGMMSDVQIAKYSSVYGSKLPCVNFAEIANNIGGTGYRVESVEEMIPAIEKAMSSHTATLLDVVCSRPSPPNFTTSDLTSLQSKMIA